jgi:YcxB-like protein
MEIEITYNLEANDLIIAYNYMNKTNKFNNLFRWAIYSFFTIVIIKNLITIKASLGEKIFAGIVVLGIVILGFNLLIWLINFLMIRANLPKDETSGVLGEHTIRITPDQLIEYTSVNQSYHQWITIKKIQELPEHLLLILGSNHVHIIPKRAFSSDIEYQEFYRKTTEYKERSLG